MVGTGWLKGVTPGLRRAGAATDMKRRNATLRCLKVERTNRFSPRLPSQFRRLTRPMLELPQRGDARVQVLVGSRWIADVSLNDRQRGGIERVGLGELAALHVNVTEQH